MIVTAFALYVRRRDLYTRVHRKLLRALFLVYAAGVPWFFWYWSFQAFRTDYFGDRSSGGMAALLSLIFLCCGMYLSLLLSRGEATLFDRIRGTAGVVMSVGFGSVVFTPEFVALAFPKAPDVPHLLVMVGVVAGGGVPYAIIGDGGNAAEPA